MTNNITIIPARGGSKGVPGKNIKDFGGKPLIVHSIEYANASKLNNKVYVSTDDDEIAQISQDAGASIIHRPPEIADDTASTESAIEHALSVMDTQPEIIVLLQATSPLRPEKSLDRALKHFIDGEFDSLLSISPTHRFFWEIEEDIAKPKYDYLNRPRRQDMKIENIQYVENGSLYIFTREHFEKTGNRLGGKIGYTIFSEEYCLEIDTPQDFITLETIDKSLHKK